MNARPEQFLARLRRRLDSLGRTPARQESTIRKQALAARWMVKHTGAKQ